MEGQGQLKYLLHFSKDFILNWITTRVGVKSKPRVSIPKSFTFVLKSTMNTKKWYLKMNNHPLIRFIVLEGILLHNLFRNLNFP